MSITGMLFLFVFLPLSLAIYYLAADSAKEYVLLVISFLFYAVGSVEHFCIFIVAVCITVILGRIIGSCCNIAIKKFILIIGIIFNTGFLFYYKYYSFALTTWGKLSSTEVKTKEILLPLGISFFTFKSISYLVDVYSRKAELIDNPVHDALYLSIFSQIQSGPITRHNDLTKKWGGGKEELFSQGVFKFMIGFNKKVLVANVLANITNEVFGAPFENVSTFYAWLGSICYSLQLFFDFSGYSDMAIGLTEMFGYSCMENFDYPYMTESISKFWRRWHISLGNWFRDYIYIPLGGSRNSRKFRVYVNLLVVWILTGIWHGAAWNFVVWGLGYFAVISFERFTGLPDRLRTKIGKVFYRIAALLFINFQWVLFNSDGIRSGLRFIKRMILYYPDQLSDRRAVFLLKDYSFFIILAIILCFPIVPAISKKLSDKRSLSMIYEALVYLVTAVAFIWAVSFVVAGQNNPFAYANF